MTQDGSSRSTGTELSEAQKGQLEDADTLVSDKICELLNNAMRTDEELIRVDAVPPTHGEFSPDTRDLLRRVWTIAAQFQHREVVADHLITGMVTGDESIGAPSPNKFSEAGIDLAALRSRTFARLAGLSTPTALDDLPVPTQPVAPDVVRWISGAVRIAQARDEYGREVSPDDLVQVVLNARQPGHPLHELLQDVTDRFDPGKQLAPPSTGLIPDTLDRADA
jgi:hypothetical protein